MNPPRERGERRNQAGRSSYPSPDQASNNLAVHVGQASIDAVVTEGELGVIDAEQMQDSGVNVVDGRGMAAIGRFVAPWIAFANMDPAFDPAAAEPVGEA